MHNRDNFDQDWISGERRETSSRSKKDEPSFPSFFTQEMRVCITVFLDVVHETAATVDISL